MIDAVELVMIYFIMMLVVIYIFGFSFGLYFTIKACKRDNKLYGKKEGFKK